MKRERDTLDVQIDQENVIVADNGKRQFNDPRIETEELKDHQFRFQTAHNQICKRLDIPVALNMFSFGLIKELFPHGLDTTVLISNSRLIAPLFGVLLLFGLLSCSPITRIGMCLMMDVTTSLESVFLV